MTLDGLMEPLGTSQVVRVARGLSNRGYQMALCSLERARDREEPGREERFFEDLREEGISWRRGTYRQGGSADVGANLWALRQMLKEELASGPVRMVHARSYVACSVALSLCEDRGIPVLFDIRGFWVDERREQGRWFTGPLRLGMARRWEESLYERTAGVVSLTEEAARAIQRGEKGPWSADRPIRVIPTCADYGEFGLGGPSNVEGIPHSLSARLKGRLVVGFVGAVEQAYCVEESLRLFHLIKARRPDAHLLCLTRNPSALLPWLRAARIGPDEVSVTTATHEEMPAYLAVMDWGLLMRRTGPSHRAAMPTKLAEFFAAGVRPIQWGCNAEVRRWVEAAGSGVVLKGLNEEALAQAADEIARRPASVQELLRARWRTREHFDLACGIERYDEVYRAVLKRSHRPRLRVLMLTEGEEVPASRFRVQQLLPHLQARGIECTVRAAYGPAYPRMARTPAGPMYKLGCRLKRVPAVIDADRFDLVFVQRPALPFTGLPEVLGARRNDRVIFDVDDAIFVRRDGEPSRRLQRAFQESVAAARHVICGNQYLADHTEKVRPTTVIPTVVDTALVRPAPEVPRGSPPVVGWMGSASNFVSLATVAPVLRRLAEAGRARIRIVADAPFAPLRGVENVEEIPWSADDEVALLQSFQIGIMPLLDNASTRGKCGFKALQYMAVQIPVVASAVGVNREILSGVGFLAETTEEFEDALNTLIDDESLRLRLGIRGRRRVEERYSVEAVIDTYVEIFEAVAHRRPVPIREVRADGGRTPAPRQAR